jgi:hypothetical protein
LPVKNLSYKKAPHIERSADRARSYKRNAPVSVRKGAVERTMVGHHLELRPMTLNLGKIDRIFRLVVGVAIGTTGILSSGHPILGRLAGVVGALVILSAGCGA